MPLSAGDRLGPHEIVAKLGAGGMGEVYRARDTRLGREIGIKVLPADVARDAERLSRFRREAQLLVRFDAPQPVSGAEAPGEIVGFDAAPDGLSALVGRTADRLMLRADIRLWPGCGATLPPVE